MFHQLSVSWTSYPGNVNLPAHLMWIVNLCEHVFLAKQTFNIQLTFSFVPEYSNILKYMPVKIFKQMAQMTLCQKNQNNTQNKYDISHLF